MDLIPHIDLLKLNKKIKVIILPNKLIFLSNPKKNEIKDLIKKEEKKLFENIEKEKYENHRETTASITFLPTFDCNLRCIYCYARGGEEQKYLTKELVKDAIDAVFLKTKASRIKLHFAGGGEPFLNFDVMNFAVNYSKNLFNVVDIGLVTNGTFNTKQRQWIINNNADLRISFDGVAQDYQRPSIKPYKDVIINNIKTLSNINYDFMIQCIVTSQSVNKMVENIKYFSKLGVKYLKIEPVHISEISRGTQNLIPKPKEFANNFIKMLKFIIKEGLNIKVDSSFFSRPTLGYYCGINEPNIIVTPEGYITACVEITRRKEPFSDILIYGKLNKRKIIFNNTSINKLKKLHFSNYKKCRKCNLKLICKGGCPMRNIFAHGFSFKASEYTCQIEKILIPKVFSLIYNNPEYAKIIFDDFRIKIC